MLFAELPSPTSIQIGGWIIACGGVLWFLNQGAKFIEHFKMKPPPHEIYQPLGDYVVSGHLMDLEKRLNSQVLKLSNDLGQLQRDWKIDRDMIMAASEARSEKIHTRVNQILEVVAELRGEVRANK
jgi:hypothetical protein